MSWSDALWDCFLPVFPSGCPPRMWHCNWHGAGALHPGGVGVRHQPLLLRVHTERSEVQLPQEVCTCSPHLILASAFRLFVNVLFSHCISPLHFIDVFLCFISQEKIPISLTPFLTRKIHNLSLCCLFFVRLLSLISTTDKARRQCRSIYPALPVHHILIIVVSTWGRCSHWKTVGEHDRQSDRKFCLD